MQAAERRAAALYLLEQSGLCRLPGSVPYLRPYENSAWVPEVQTIQQQFFRKTGSVDAEKVYGPSSFLCVQQQDGQEISSDLGVELSIAQAPASFALPLTPNSPFNLPFRVTLRLAATSPTSVKVTVRASVLTIEEMIEINYWMPLQSMDPRLVGAQVHADLRLVECGKTLADGRPVYTSTHDFLFLDLQFTQTTNKEPVFLVFHVDLPPPSPHLFTLFLLPTVVCNPGNAIEHANAAQLLWKGALPPRPSDRPRWTFADFCTHVTHELQVSIGMNRALTTLDHMALAQRAGFFLKLGANSGDGTVNASIHTVGSTAAANNANVNDAAAAAVVWDNPCVEGGPTTEEEVECLQLYVRRTQALLKLMREYYEMLDPQIISGFSIGRREAVSLLESHPPGTFLLRFSYEAGSLAISYVEITGKVIHVKLTMAQLQQVSLEEILSIQGNLDYLLDLNSGLRVPRELVLDRGYVNEPRIDQLVRSQNYNIHNHNQQQANYHQHSTGQTGTSPLNNGVNVGGVRGGGIMKPSISNGASTNPSSGSAHADVQHQASEGEQLPEQGLMYPLGASPH